MAAVAQWVPSERRQTVLVVDDEKDVRDTLRDELELLGYVVLEASDAKTGLALIEHHLGPVDLLLTDIVMPGLFGHKFAAQAVVMRPTTRVVYVTAHDEQLVQRLLKQQPALSVPDGHLLQKPVTLDKLASTVRASLCLRRDGISGLV